MNGIIITLLLSMTTSVRANFCPDLLGIYDLLFSGYHVKTAASPTRNIYDFIVIGAGSGGSTVANRLSSNPKWKILLIEAGKAETAKGQIPALVSALIDTDSNWGYRVEPQKSACLGMENHQCLWPRGKSLGGTSAINYMIHTRGNKLDYDDWATLGNYGWSYNDVLPYFKKSEKFNVPGLANDLYHGTAGNLWVEQIPFHSTLSRQFLKAAEELGYPIVDPNGPHQLGFSYLQVNMNGGTRCSASKAYLRVTRPNLDIVTDARATKLLINSTTNLVYGVEYVKNKRTYRINASKEVILSAGTIDSAKLLMLSGIGPREHLQQLGIPVIKDSKVGYNLFEHVGFLGLTFMVNQSVALTTTKAYRPSAILEYAVHHSGILSNPGGAEALAFLRTKFAKDSRPDLELLFGGASLNSDNGFFAKTSHGVSEKLYEAVYKGIEGKDAFSIWPIVQNPRSYGRIKLRSANPFDDPIIEPNSFVDPIDIEVILEGIKEAVLLTKTQAFQAYGARLHDVKIPGCGNFDFGSDNYWRCAIRHLPAMLNHEVGTAKMGPEHDTDAVVDPQLKVYGVQGLRVVDASVMPKMPVGHVNAGIYMIGEKASDMIKETWKNAV